MKDSHISSCIFKFKENIKDNYYESIFEGNLNIRMKKKQNKIIIIKKKYKKEDLTLTKIIITLRCKKIDRMI